MADCFIIRDTEQVHVQTPVAQAAPLAIMLHKALANLSEWQERSTQESGSFPGVCVSTQPAVLHVLMLPAKELTSLYLKYLCLKE